MHGIYKDMAGCKVEMSDKYSRTFTVLKKILEIPHLSEEASDGVHWTHIVQSCSQLSLFELYIIMKKYSKILFDKDKCNPADLIAGFMDVIRNDPMRRELRLGLTDKNPMDFLCQNFIPQWMRQHVGKVYYVGVDIEEQPLIQQYGHRIQIKADPRWSLVRDRISENPTASDLMGIIPHINTATDFPRKIRNSVLVFSAHNDDPLESAIVDYCGSNPILVDSHRFLDLIRSEDIPIDGFCTYSYDVQGKEVGRALAYYDPQDSKLRMRILWIQIGEIPFEPHLYAPNGNITILNRLFMSANLRDCEMRGFRELPRRNMLL